MMHILHIGFAFMNIVCIHAILCSIWYTSYSVQRTLYNCTLMYNVYNVYTIQCVQYTYYMCVRSV